MSILRSARRKLRTDKVLFAKQVQYERNELMKKAVVDRLKTDVEFAKDVVRAVGDDLPANIREAADKVIAADLLKSAL